MVTNVRPFYGFEKSSLNPADDPTRHVKLRKPSLPVLPWAEALASGDPSVFDEEMRAQSSHVEQMTGAPPEEDLLPRFDIDLRTSLQVRRDRRKSQKKSRCNNLSCAARVPSTSRVGGISSLHAELMLDARRKPPDAGLVPRSMMGVGEAA